MFYKSFHEKWYSTTNRSLDLVDGVPWKTTVNEHTVTLTSWWANPLLRFLPHHTAPACDTASHRHTAPSHRDTGYRGNPAKARCAGRGLCYITQQKAHFTGWGEHVMGEECPQKEGPACRGFN